LTLNELKGILRKNEIDDTYIEHTLIFLEKVKRVEKFTVKMDGTNDILCVKFLKDSNSSVSLKDTAIVNLSLSIRKIDRTITELENRMEETLAKAKEFLRKSDRKQAGNVLKKKKMIQKSRDHFSDIKLSLEQNLLDIKSMESNQTIHNVLLESSKATKDLKININDFENVTDMVRDNVDHMKDVNNIISSCNNENMDNDELEKELKELQIAEEKGSKEKAKILQEEEKVSEKLGISKLFPAANKNTIIKKELNNNKEENKENFINNNSFEEILEELNKK